MEKQMEKAIFAGGCFWCMEPAFDALDGVTDTIVGYTGGDADTATYKDVGSGKTNHVEAIEVTYDPAKVSYEKLLSVYWDNIDPTDPTGQFFDRGKHYEAIIFYQNEREREIAEASKAALAASDLYDKPIVTRIEPAQAFYAAEDYHQNYYQTNPEHYNRYKEGSGRGAHIRRIQQLKKSM